MSRGGYFVMRPVVILHDENWQELSCAALGAWVKLRALSKLTESPISDRERDRLRVTESETVELIEAGLIADEPEGIEALGMPGLKPRPGYVPRLGVTAAGRP